MDECLEEYRKKFSTLKSDSIFLHGMVSKEAIKDIVVYLDDVVSFDVVISGSEGKDLLKINFIGVINSPVYQILSDKDGSFTINEQKINNILKIYQIKGDNANEKNSSIDCVDDFFNLNERKNIKDNIADLLSGITLKYIGEVPFATENQVEQAKKNRYFIKEFAINVEKSKVLKKNK